VAGGALFSSSEFCPVVFSRAVTLHHSRRSHTTVSSALLSSLVFIFCLSTLAGPLVAAVNAQAQATMSSINFIQNVGFDANGDAIHVEFVYNRTNTTTGLVKETKMTVPLLTVVPIPFFRVRHLD
jgi:Protein of unknown function (DUF2589)